MARRAKRTPAECIGMILKAAMGANGIDAVMLANLADVHPNTVRADLKDPDGMPMKRVWLYFTVLGVPVDEGMQAFSESFARSLTVR